MEKLGIYIHIPYCKSKCSYCDFISFTNKDLTVDNYIKCLIKEIELYAKKITDKYKVTSIFLGGGTPSYIKADSILKILEEIYKNFNIEELEEVTLEANPESLTDEKIKIYKLAGINRISLGGQSFNNKILKLLGRSHRQEDIVKSITRLKKNGIKNINLDLMFGLPGQTYRDAIDSIKRAIDLPITHLSHYGLILEENTKLYKMVEKGKISLMDEETDRKIYHDSRKILLEKGFQHYEISNFALKNCESKHNLLYWNLDNYLGLGVSSHSNLGDYRFNNYSTLEEYEMNLKLNKYPIESYEEIELKERISEFAIMGLRKTEGINFKDFSEKFSLDFKEIYSKEISKNKNIKLLLEDNKGIRLSKKGLDFCNQVELDFYKI